MNSGTKIGMIWYEEYLPAYCDINKKVVENFWVWDGSVSHELALNYNTLIQIYKKMNDVYMKEIAINGNGS
jgi:hypothetical protein